jgi:hypothetical protein
MKLDLKTLKENPQRETQAKFETLSEQIAAANHKMHHYGSSITSLFGA